MLDKLIEISAMDNIAEEFTVSDDFNLADIGSDVVEGFDNDLKSREGWMGEMKEAMDLALQVRDKKNFPWENASNIKMPLLTEAAIHYNSMMYPALIPPTDIVKTRIIGEDHNGEKERQSIRVSKHMSYQVLEEMEEWEEEMDIGLMIQPILGNMYKKTYFDAGKGRNMSEMLSPIEFVVDYNTKSLETAYRKTHVMPMTKNDIKKKILSGEYLDVEIGDPVIKDAEKEGETPIVADSSTTFEVLEQHTYLDLDNDGLEEPYIITVERNSREVLRIVAGYEAENILADMDGVVYDVVQEQYFTKYGFVPNPDGAFLDLGLGKLLGPTNHTINAIMNQLMDAGTRAVTGGGFLGRGIKIKGGNLKFKMGEYKRIDSTGDDIRKNIIHLPQVEPSGTLFNLLNLLISQAQRLSSTLDSQVGENPGQNQKATTSAIVQENGQKIFNGIYKRNHRSLKKELKKIFLLNSVNLPTESYLNVLDGDFPEEMARTIAKSDYDPRSVNIIPAADSAYTSSQQKMSKSRALMEKLNTGLVNPTEVVKRSLEAEEQSNIPKLMEVPEKQPSLEEKQFMAEQQEKQAEMRRKMTKDAEDNELEWAKHRLNILKMQQADVKIRADSILSLAKAEAAEVGTQSNKYKADLDLIIAESAAINQSLTSLADYKQRGFVEEDQKEKQMEAQQSQQSQQAQPQMPPQEMPPINEQ